MGFSKYFPKDTKTRLMILTLLSTLAACVCGWIDAGLEDKDDPQQGTIKTITVTSQMGITFAFSAFIFAILTHSYSSSSFTLPKGDDALGTT